MVPISDEELEAMLSEPESDRVEFKQAWTDNVAEKVRQAVCAFANDLPGHGRPGVVAIGVADDGDVVGCDVSDQLLTKLGAIKEDGQIVPPPTLTVSRRSLRDKTVALVTVWPADAPPVRYKGRIWVRVGPRRALATQQDERILNERRRHHDRSFDAQPVIGCALDELDRRVFEGVYLPALVARDVLDANDRSYAQKLAACGMVASADDPTPTIAGLLGVGITPRSWIPCAYIQFLRFRGTDETDPVTDAQEIDGTLDAMVRRLDEKLRAHLTVAVDFTGAGVSEARMTPYPPVALQQITRNAVMHRTYEGTNAPVRVNWYDDRIEILSPGGTFGCVTAENFGRPGFSDYRNPLIATIMRTYGFVQRFGVGIATAQKAMRDNGNPQIEFSVERNHVQAVLRRAP